MARKSSYDISVDNLSTAIGVRLPDYAVAPIGPLVTKVVSQLERMIASGAPDSETGDVVDPLIDAWVSQQLAVLRAERSVHEQRAEELVIQADALAARARRHAVAAQTALDDALTEHDEIQSIVRGIDARRAGRL